VNAAELRWMFETAYHDDRPYPGRTCTECHCGDCMPDHPKDQCAIRLALIGPKRRPRIGKRGK
jgi:hypothetical protein